MAELFDAIDDQLAEWLESQPIFFVATAPSGSSGHVNLSPKGMAGTFRVLTPHRVAYLDQTGSGAETIAHVRENGRITMMFCAFERRPRILRLYGTGRILVPAHDEFPSLASQFSHHAGTRSIIVVEVDRICESCGYGVPEMAYVADRRILDLKADQMSPDELTEYWHTSNAESIDGLPALD